MHHFSGFAEINSGKLYYDISGKGPPLVFIHGGLSDSRIWDGQIPDFSGRFTIVRFDCRGFGQSDLPREPFFPARDLKELLDFLGIDRTFLLGHSMGGAAAIDFSLEYPKKTRALVLAAPQINGFPYSQQLLDKGAELISTARKKGAETALEILIEDPFWRYNLPAAEKFEAREKFILLARHFFQVFRWNPEFIRWIEPYPLYRLNEIEAPVLIIRAGRDHPDTNRAINRFIEIAENTKLKDIPDAGHLPHLEYPDLFKRLALDFLKTHSISTSGSRQTK